MALAYVAIGAASLGLLCYGVRLYNKIFVWRIWKVWEHDPELYLEGRLMSGVTVVVTGANSGIGKEVVRELYAQGAKVVLACRNEKETMEVIKEITESDRRLGRPANGRMMMYRYLDLSSFISINDFADALDFRVDMLVNNAGAYGLEFQPEKYSGIEPHMMVNHFGPAMLTMRMCDRGVRRIINVTSQLAVGAQLADPYQFRRMSIANKREFLSYKLSDKQKYATSKLANMLFMTHLLNQHRVAEVCFATPGFCLTKLHRNIGTLKLLSMSVLAPFLLMIMRTPRQGAQSIVACCLSRRVTQKAFYINCTPNHEIYQRCVLQTAMTPHSVFRLTMFIVKDYL